MNSVKTTKSSAGNYKLTITHAEGKVYEMTLENLRNYETGLKGWELQSWDFDMSEAANFTTKSAAIKWLTYCFEPEWMEPRW